MLDRSGSTSNEISPVVYHMPPMDITEDVLAELNKAYHMTHPAPADKNADKNAKKK